MTAPDSPTPAAPPPIDLGEGGVDRLVAAAAQQIANRGLAAVSSRSVAQDAGAAASVIAYRFGGIEQLYGLAFAHGAALSEAWRRTWLEEIALLPEGPAGAALALEHVIAAWTSEARPLALLYQEALAAAPGEGAAAAWTRGWRDFWLRVAAVFGLDEVDGRLLHLFFESEALYHLSAWSPALERAALREMCEHFAQVYLDGPPVRLTGTLEAAERASGVLPDGPMPAAAARIVDAAAEIVEQKGLGGLTHRAVALRAGVTTGAVTHHFRTVESLVAGTIRGQVRAMQRPPPGEPRRAPSPAASIMTAEQMFKAFEDYVIVDRPWGPALRRRHLFLASLRRSEMAASAAVIRFAHGGTLGAAFERAFHPPPNQRSLYAGVLARMGAASWFATAADDTPRASQTALFAQVRARLLRHFGQG